MKRLLLLSFCFIVCIVTPRAQVKILFDATKAETAGNADWIIDADAFNISYSNGPATIGWGNDANAQQTPTPLQGNITAGTIESFWKGGLSYWAVDCVKKGYQVATLPYNGLISYGNVSNPQDLTNYNIFVVDEPNILFTTNEKVALINFVQNGGGLFIISNHTQSDRNNDGYDSPEIWNDLFTNNGIVSNPFGITFDLSTISGNSYNISTNINDSLLHGSNGNVSQVLWSSGTTMTLDPAVNPTVKASVYKTGSSNAGNTKVMVAYARFGLGKIVAFGDSSPFDDGTGDTNDQLYNGYIADANGNHQKLIMNATQWLATNTTLLSGQINFNCFRKMKDVSIMWHTPTEIGLSYFNVQKSYNGKDFFNLRNIKATGASNYSFIDSDVSKADKHYYRLEVVNSDGSKTYTKTIEVKGQPSSPILLYPNPCKEIIFFSEPDVSNVIIRTVLGNIALTKTNITNGQLNLNALQKGLYFIEFINTNGYIATERFIKL